jgi:indole-3-glycerol phosphate synthase
VILETILADKRAEVEAKKARVSLQELKSEIQNAPLPRSFELALQGSEHGIRGPRTSIRLIAEVKKASPSRGLIREDFDPVAIAEAYEEAGASAISVLTDKKYFQGRITYLREVRRSVDVPVLRKDFIIDPYQIYESRAAGADAVLLIVAALTRDQLKEFMALVDSLGMTPLVETHTREELEVAVELGARVVGINNRDLRTFETHLDTTLGLATYVPGDRVLVSESGIFTRKDIESLMQVGVDAVLVGESLMRQTDPRLKIRELLDGGIKG